MGLTVRYSNFWPTFDPEKTLFTSLLRKYFDESTTIVHNPEVKVDIEFVSVFYFENIVKQFLLRLGTKISDERKWDYFARVGRGFRLSYENRSNKTIWYTGENKRFPLHHFDGRISFDPNDSEFSNIFFPYWMLRLDWGIGRNEYEIQPSIESLMSPRKAEERPIKACSFSNLRETNRERISKAVEKLFEVDTYGGAVGRFVNSKLLTSQSYALQICTENDLYPNYVTEKLQESWVARNVPIWTGLDSEGWFNKSAIIDLTMMNSHQIEERLAKLSIEEILHMQEQPLLLKKPTLVPLIELIGKMV